MKDYNFMHQSLIKEVAKFENTITSKTMARLGLSYSINYGLSINQLNSIAGIIDKDDNYARFLWKQKERESKLIALRIFETQEFALEDLQELVTGITNVELAEQSAMQFFAKQNNIIDIALYLIGLKDFAQLAGYLTISRFALLNKGADFDIFTKLLAELLRNQPCNDDALYLKRAFAQALLKIALINTELKDMVKNEIASITEHNSEFGNYLQQEVIEMLY